MTTALAPRAPSIMVALCGGRKMDSPENACCLMDTFRTPEGDSPAHTESRIVQHS